MKASRIRSCWIAVVSLFYTGWTSLSAIIKSWFGKVDRRWVDEALQKWAVRIFKVARIHYRVINPYQIEPKPGHPTIIMCNHSSLYDIPLSFMAFPKQHIRMLAKIELHKVPLFGRAMRVSEFPGVDRKNRTQAIKDLEKLHHLLASGITMWIAPEGTRSSDGRLAAFKKGGFITAIQMQAEIIPIAIRGAHSILPARSIQYNLDQTAEIHVGQPIDASRYTLDNKEELIKIVHQAMQQLLEN